MLVKGILLQAPGEPNSSVDEWATFGGFFLMLHIPLLLIQRCVVFRFQVKFFPSMISFIRGMNSIGHCIRYSINTVLLSWVLTYHLGSPSMTFTLKICGCLTSAIPPISSLPVWRFTRQAMRGDSFVRWHYHSLKPVCLKRINV
jgi:hypothetical protein